MDENPYEAPQVDDHPIKPTVLPHDRWPYLNGIVTCLASAIVLSVVANLVFVLDGKDARLTDAVGVCVWVTAVLIGVWEYRRAAKRASR